MDSNIPPTPPRRQPANIQRIARTSTFGTAQPDNQHLRRARLLYFYVGHGIRCTAKRYSVPEPAIEQELREHGIERGALADLQRRRAA